MLKIIAMPLGYLLKSLYGLIGVYGIALIVLTVLVKACLYPVYAKSMKSSYKMSEMSSKVKEIQQKYGKDQAMVQEKTMELYKQEGVSMYGGCVPMIVQMIVIMGLFTLLRNPLVYMTDDNMLFAIHESFLWIKDLAQPDPWILPILAGIATYISYTMSGSMNMNQPGQSQAQAQTMQRYMKYFFPIMILWMARSYPAGLAIYWFGSQVIQIFYNLFFNRWKKKMIAEKKAKERALEREKEREKERAKARAEKAKAKA